MVDVNTQNKTISVNVSSSGVSSNVNASGDTTLYYSNKAREWAISNRIVDGVDYSSKYYAGRANQSALNAQSFAQSAQDSYKQVQNVTEQALINIEIKTNESADELETITEQNIEEIIIEKNNSITNIQEVSATEQAELEEIKEGIINYAGIYYDDITDEDIDVDILESGYVSDSELEEALATKQDKGDYALVEDIPTQVSELENDSNYATQTQVMQAIASIPQFSISIVDELPLAGEKMMLYLVSKGGESPDIYDEYIWIEETSSFEFLGTTAVDLTDYVKKTDYAGDVGGVIKISSVNGLAKASNGYLLSVQKTLEDYNSGVNSMFVSKGTLENIKDDYVKRGLTENTIELTGEEKSSARTLIGAVGSTDYAGNNKVGLISAQYGYGLSATSSGHLYCNVRTLKDYNGSLVNSAFISKGTLDNVLTQYSKTVLTTEADYEALETKDSNTLYLIEE